MWELDCEESWVPKNWCFWSVVLEKTLESPLDCKEIQLVHSKGDQSWVFIGRTDAKAETPVLWPPHANSWLTGKDSDAGRDWGQEEKGMTEDEMAGWHHRLHGHEFDWTPGVGDGQGGLVCCDSWGYKESDMTEWLNWTDWWYIYYSQWTNIDTLLSSGQFISLCGFLPHCNKDLDWWTNYSSDRIPRLLCCHSKDSKQQTSYSSVTAQADRSFIKKSRVHSCDMEVGWPGRSSLNWLLNLPTSLSSPPRAKTGTIIFYLLPVKAF